MPQCLTPAVERYICAAWATVKGKLISSGQTSCSLALQVFNKTIILKIPFLVKTTFHKTAQNGPS